MTLIRAGIALGLATLAGCAPEDEGGFGVGGSDGEEPGTGPATSGSCPSGMVQISFEEGAVVLGEWDPNRLSDPQGEAYQYALSEEEYSGSAYCIDEYPFPGQDEEWAVEALYYEQLPSLEQRLAAGGRRLCTVTELMLAAAGPENWRFSTDPEQRIAGDCDPDDMSPDPIGSHSRCRSPLGVHDFNVRSSWARIGESERPVLEGLIPEELLPYAVYGGTSRSDTFYAPTNFGLHFHDEGLMEGGGYKDDDLRTCADPETSTPEREAAWEEARAEFIEQGSSYRAWL